MDSFKIFEKSLNERSCKDLSKDPPRSSEILARSLRKIFEDLWRSVRNLVKIFEDLGQNGKDP